MILCVQNHFCAAHFLPNYDGKCANLHGHTWHVEAFYEGNPDPKTGMVRDFKELKSQLHSVTNFLDHKCLNNLNPDPTAFFPESNPTAENIAGWILDMLRTREGMGWRRVRLWESETAYVEVRT